ncbi:MAG: autotransporter-associated beta strand repeat-containing protein [Tepidisphaeraceae bacterium]
MKDGGAIIDTSGFNVTVGQALLASGSGGLTKKGAGTLTLGGANTYTGLTSVEAGRLAVNGSIVSGVSLSGGASLGGTGTIAGAITAAANTIVAPGNSIGTLTLGSATIGGLLSVEYDGTGAGSIDLLNVLGSLNIAAANVDFSQLGAPADDAAYVFASYGSLTGTFTATTNVPAGYTINYAYAGNNIALVPIPEPTTAVAMGMASLLGLRRRGR